MAAHDLELELRPLGQSPAPFPPAASGSFEVPDLDLAPVSRGPAPLRTSSGLRAAVVPPLIDLEDDRRMVGADLVTMPSTGLDLDLVPGELPRRSSYPSPASLAPQRAQASPLPPSGPPPQSARKEPRSSLPPVISAPPPAGFAPHEDASTLERLKPGLRVLGIGTLMIILEVLYSAITGDVFSIGPLRTSILAAALMVAGLLLCVFRLLKRS
jgi:hypothetical protein